VKCPSRTCSRRPGKLVDPDLREEAERSHVDSEDGDVLRGVTGDGKKGAVSAERDQQF
jgi:hypothetical protein